MRVCVVVTENELLATELIERLDDDGHEVVQPNPLTILFDIGDVLESCDAAVFVVPRSEIEYLALGVAVGRSKVTIVLANEVEYSPPPGILVCTSVPQVLDVLHDRVAPAPPLAIDHGLLVARGACDEAIAWFDRRYPNGFNASAWTLEEQLAALRDGGARWVRVGVDYNWIPFWPMDDVDLSNMNLQKAYLRGASFARANLEGADLRGAVLHGAHLAGASLRGAKLQNAQLQRADLRRAYLDGADLTRACLRGATLTGATLFEAVLAEVDAYAADLSDIDFSSTELSGSRLSSANLSGSDFTATVMRGLAMMHANLKEANLSGADLGRVNLTGADLSRAVYDGAVWDGAELTSVRGGIHVG